MQNIGDFDLEGLDIAQKLITRYGISLSCGVMSQNYIKILFLLKYSYKA